MFLLQLAKLRVVVEKSGGTVEFPSIAACQLLWATVARLAGCKLRRPEIAFGLSTHSEVVLSIAPHCKQEVWQIA